MGQHPCVACGSKCLNQFIPQEKLTRIVNVVGYETGENIIHQGTYVQNYHFLCEGIVKVGARNHRGKKALFSLLHPPEIIEKSNFSHSKQYHIDATAVTDARIGMITIEDFDRLLLDYPELSVHIREIISSELDFQFRKSAARSWGGSRESLIWLLTELYAKVNQNGKCETPVNLHLSERDLANMLGISRGTVVRHLSDLRKKGLARATRGSVIVLDYKSLSGLTEKL